MVSGIVLLMFIASYVEPIRSFIRENSLPIELFLLLHGAFFITMTRTNKLRHKKPADLYFLALEFILGMLICVQFASIVTPQARVKLCYQSYKIPRYIQKSIGNFFFFFFENWFYFCR